VALDAICASTAFSTGISLDTPVPQVRPSMLSLPLQPFSTGISSTASVPQVWHAMLSLYLCSFLSPPARSPSRTPVWETPGGGASRLSLPCPAPPLLFSLVASLRKLVFWQHFSAGVGAAAWPATSSLVALFSVSLPVSMEGDISHKRSSSITRGLTRFSNKYISSVWEEDTPTCP
jgi:hypothetical protein